MNEELIRQIIRESLMLEASKASVGSKIAASSGGVYKYASTSRGAPHVRLTVDAKTDPEAGKKAKSFREEDFKAILKKAGFAVISMLPKGITAPEFDETFSSKFPAYKVADPEDGSEQYVVFAGGEATDKEKAQTAALSQALADLGDILLVPDPDSSLEELRRPRRIIGVENVSDTPKADIFLKSDNEADNVYISLKDGKNVKSFQQYGGMTKLIDKPEVLQFFKDVILSSEVLSPNKIKLAAPSFFRSLPENSELAVLGVYGSDAYPISETGFGVNKVHMLLQAVLPEVTPLSDDVSNAIKSQYGVSDDKPVYRLVGSHVVSYPDIPGEEYAPVMHARPDGSSKLSIGKFLTKEELASAGLAASISGVRFLIYPKGKLSGTSQDLDTYMSSLPEVALVREYIREALLTEAFTKTDEKAIEVMARKEIDKKWKDHEKMIDKMFGDRDKTLFRNDAFYKVIAQIYQQLQRAYAEDQFKYATRYTRKDIPLARFRPS